MFFNFSELRLSPTWARHFFCTCLFIFFKFRFSPTWACEFWKLNLSNLIKFRFSPTWAKDFCKLNLSNFDKFRFSPAWAKAFCMCVFGIFASIVLSWLLGHLEASGGLLGVSWGCLVSPLKVFIGQFSSRRVFANAESCSK